MGAGYRHHLAGSDFGFASKLARQFLRRGAVDGVQPYFDGCDFVAADRPARGSDGGGCAHRVRPAPAKEKGGARWVRLLLSVVSASGLVDFAPFRISVFPSGKTRPSP